MDPKDWTPGSPIESPVGPMVSIDPATASSQAIYKLMIGAIVPRPIAWVSTVSPEGVTNLAPFSFFNGVSSRPPCLVVSITRKPSGERKDTLRNIEATGQFVVNTVAEWLAGPMNHTSAAFPYGVDELAQVGLTPLASARVRPPRVKESPVHFECELHRTMELGEGDPGSAVLVIGRIVMVHVHAPAYDQGRIRLDEIQPLSRLGGASYGRVSGVFDLPRPSVPGSDPGAGAGAG